MALMGQHPSTCSTNHPNTSQAIPLLYRLHHQVTFYTKRLSGNMEILFKECCNKEKKNKGKEERKEGMMQR
jgi:hypothetical protein